MTDEITEIQHRAILAAQGASIPRPTSRFVTYFGTVVMTWRLAGFTVELTLGRGGAIRTVVTSPTGGKGGEPDLNVVAGLVAFNVRLQEAFVVDGDVYQSQIE